MAQEAKSRGLGRGLGALLGEAATPQPVSGAPQVEETSDGGERGRGVRDLPIEYLQPNPHQPRRRFVEEDLVDLANSIKERGVLQPIIARPVDDSGTKFEIVAGERRWRAAQRAQRHTVPVIVRELTNSEVLEIGLIENVQRADLNSMEESMGYIALMQRFKYTQDQLAKLIGKSRSHIANMTRLVSLPMPVQGMIADGRLSAGHARALIGSEDAEELAETVIAKGLNVRQTEALAKKGSVPSHKPRSANTDKIRKALTAPDDKDADTLALERNVSNALGLAVSIDHEGDAGGTVTISYKTLEQLDDICRRLAQGNFG